MYATSVLFLLLTCSSVFAYSSDHLYRRQRSLPVSSSLSNDRLNDNEIRIDSSSEELPEIIRRKKSTKKDKLTLEDLKEIDIEDEITKDDEINKESSKNLNERSSPTTLQEVHDVDKNKTEQVSNTDGKDKDRIRRHQIIMSNPLASGDGDTMLIMPKPNYIQNVPENNFNTRPRTNVGLWSQHGAGIGLGGGGLGGLAGLAGLGGAASSGLAVGGATHLPGYFATPAVATVPVHSSSSISSLPTIQATSSIGQSSIQTVPTTYTSTAISALPIPTKHLYTSQIPIQTHIATQPTTHQATYYATVLPSQHTQTCLCPCNQYGYSNGYQNSGHKFSYIGGLGGGSIGKSVSNLDEDILQSPFIFQGPKMHFQTSRRKSVDQFSDGHQNSADCSIDSLSNLNFDKNIMEGLMDHEERKLKKIEECAKNNNLNSVEHAMLASMINSELDLLQNEVKSMYKERVQNKQQSHQTQEQQPRQQQQRQHQRHSKP